MVHKTKTNKTKIQHNMCWTPVSANKHKNDCTCKIGLSIGFQNSDIISQEYLWQFNYSCRNTCGNSITLTGILVAIQLLSQEYLWQFNYSEWQEYLWQFNYSDRNTCGNSSNATLKQVFNYTSFMARTSYTSMRWCLLCTRPTRLVGVLKC
jgi:hypothetical protein